MKRLLKSWVFWAFVVPPLTLVTVVGVWSRTAQGYCRCGSAINQSEWRLGFEAWTLSLGGPSQDVSTSRLCLMALPADHSHDWDWRGGSMGCLLYGVRHCGGMGVFSGIEARFERDAKFRSWLLAQVESGAITRQAVALAVMSTAFPPDYAFGWTPP